MFPQEEKISTGFPTLNCTQSNILNCIVWTYKRKNGGEDLIEGDKDSLAQCGYRFLEAIERIPGLNEATKKEQQEKLSKWVEAVRRACADLDRLEVADEWLGNLFSHAPVGEDGVWPDEAVRNVMENIRSQFISLSLIHI